jgi:ankyrin repeat protein
MSELLYAKHLMRYEQTLQLLQHCRKGDKAAILKCLQPIDKLAQTQSFKMLMMSPNSAQSQQQSGPGSLLSPNPNLNPFVNTQQQMLNFADINGVSPDQRDTPLTACIRFNKFAAFQCLLAYSHSSGNSGTPSSRQGSAKALAIGGSVQQLDVNKCVSPYHNGVANSHHLQAHAQSSSQLQAGGGGGGASGAGYNFANNIGCTPLIVAAKYGRFRFVLALLKAGAGE